ncbi:MAG: hypothetical protein GY863_18220 [bacterium]|nr:hypothetical protein [bacterium]
MKYLSRPEEIVLLAVWKLGKSAYGVTIRKHVQESTEKYWSIGAIYVPLERLERKGFVQSYSSEPTAERGGRSKRYFDITEEGLEALEELKKVNQAIWSGYPGIVSDKR